MSLLAMLASKIIDSSRKKCKKIVYLGFNHNFLCQVNFVDFIKNCCYPLWTAKPYEGKLLKYTLKIVITWERIQCLGSVLVPANLFSTLLDSALNS